MFVFVLMWHLVPSLLTLSAEQLKVRRDYGVKYFLLEW